MKVLVTGGSGFIGSRVTDVLLERGHELINYDIKTPTFERHHNMWFEGDVLNLDRLSACFDAFQPDALIHLAAHADIYQPGWEAFSAIHRGTEMVLAATDRYGKLERLVNTATQLVMSPGHQPHGLLDYKPYTLYGEAKAYAEALLYQWQSPVKWLSVRPANIWGAHHPSFANEIWKYINKRYYLHPQTAKPVLRSYGYVRNVAEQIVSLLELDPTLTYRQVFYTADEVMDSALWVDAFAEALTGKPARRIPVALLRTMGVAGDVSMALGKRLPIDSGRVLRMTEDYPVPLQRTFDLVGKPRVGLDEGVKETVAWLKTLPGYS